MANRPQSLEVRRSDLGDRMATGREDWQSHRQDLQGDRQDWRDQHREDWQNWADGHIENHDDWYHDWYHDCWHGDWYPGAGWSYMWDNYPVATAFGLTAWGVNRVAYGWGYWGYYNPYAAGVAVTYDYSQPLVVYSESGAASNTAQVSDGDGGISALAEARTAFRDGDHAKALSLLDATLKSRPGDTVVHEFRGLVLFALKNMPNRPRRSMRCCRPDLVGTGPP